ncbi:tRNA (adenosine(37)-N6)-threonylcarbamoyltransferase complex transferase subunit TsaD [Litorilinea aerophila]|uniref:tRNA N6-adenosine threonylcarbamoyltransferase n=1 Tax=Litorilinea aerophila TaxID=1204385 RepID=A0A540VDL4_9CHLR|nr:tRNA (adenosine(37)-N6)-threonylcarbamoyltransferase complex transferase subunit TsaD [Litorilinea aerophila]MCC9077367.1 tRNA (adenosine(37)-N6)-threonylcarbamoyltransferase complex transferase subunit TsaD [Litorilinea aerophila]OUC05931.1 tRNA threonylcarbamoyladenosine biosynthesis protein Gcp [Litorilinea aerophila]GIV76241.1 MAG: tRNA N6-adenosine threonylcarbamoyltransferase [Litorilinea sp.]
MTKILAIETSCDETAAAVVVDGRQALSNVVATQIELHRRFGGVFPEVASRQHVLAIQTVIQQALEQAGVPHVSALDAIAVTHGPGLAGSLLVGVNTAKGLAFASGLPLLPVNHLEGHIYSNWVALPGQTGEVPEPIFPVVVLIVSGGHTELILMHGHGRYRQLGSTLDDAAGEAFDKVARLLGLGFPGGPAIQRAAQQGDATRFDLPRPLMQQEEHRFNFSFSGLKTAVLNLTRQLEAEGVNPQDPETAAHIAASFQEVVAEVLVSKTLDAALTYGARQVCICGGVSANARLRTLAQERCAQAGLPLYIPPLALCTDNATMIGAAAYYRWQQDPAAVGDLGLDVFATLPLPTESD